MWAHLSWGESVLKKFLLVTLVALLCIGGVVLAAELYLHRVDQAAKYSSYLGVRDHLVQHTGADQPSIEMYDIIMEFKPHQTIVIDRENNKYSIIRYIAKDRLLNLVFDRALGEDYTKLIYAVEVDLSSDRTTGQLDVVFHWDVEQYNKYLQILSMN